MVRIWCVPCAALDRQHLLGEHVELHIIHGALTKAAKGQRAGYQRHPQTLRFVGREGQLVARHREQAAEMARRGYRHRSPLDTTWAPARYQYTPQEAARDEAELGRRQTQ